MSDQNPYAAPASSLNSESPDEQFRIRLDGQDHVRAIAIITEANQFWVAMLLSTFCVVFGSIIILIWYGVRLLQWSRLAKKYPELLATNPPPKSMQARFQTSRWKLITGIIFGAVILSIMALGVLSLFFSAPQDFNAY